MEQKKTLWIVAATGIFLSVVFVTALILYSPSMSRSTGNQIAGYSPESGWTNPRQGATPVPESGLAFNTETPASPESETRTNLTPSPFASSENADSQKIAQDSDNLLKTDKVTVISDNATVYSNGTTTIDLNSLKSSSGSGLVAQNEMTANQINTNRATESVSSVEKKSATSENYYTPSSSVAKTSAPKTAPAPKAQASTKSVAKSTTSAKSTTAAKVASTAKKAPDSFWVQAAAYTSKRNADEARSTLESNKIASEVFTFTDSNGKTFYRVRVGPYVTKSEAEYWQTRIGMIDKFASAKSVIVNTAVN